MRAPDHCTGYDVVRLPSPLDRKIVASLRERFRRIAARGRRCYVLDLEGADPNQVETAAATISILRSVREHGGDLRLVATERQTRRMLAITGLDKIMCVFSSLGQAQSARDCHAGLCDGNAPK